MTVHDDDIGGLFKAIGGKPAQFKEFSNQANAAHAQERWPLFKTVGVEKRPPPPQLLQSEKQLWQDQSPPAPLPASKPRGLTLGNRIARGLNKLNQPHSSVPPHPPLPAINHAAPPVAGHGATAGAGATRAPAQPASQLPPLPTSTAGALPAARRMAHSNRPQPQAGKGLPPGLLAARGARGETASLNPARTATSAGQRQFGTGAFSNALASAGASLTANTAARLPAQPAAHNGPSPGPESRSTPVSTTGNAPVRGAIFSRLEKAVAPNSGISSGISSGLISKAGGKTGLRAQTEAGATRSAAESPRRLFGKSAPAPEKNLFCTAPVGQDSNNDDKLSSLFERLGDGAAPAGGKPRGLFNRHG